MVVKSFFMRTAPFGGSFSLLGGITAALRGIHDLRFDDPDFQEGMKYRGYDPDFISWLSKRRRLKLKIYAPVEGSVFFENEPIASFMGSLPDVRLVEGILTEAMNFPSLALTKWNRLVRTVRPGGVLEFARRRAQNAALATLYAMLSGCSATSNADMGEFFDFDVKGTIGHEWMQLFGVVPEAYDDWLEHQPDKPIGLVDTVQCMSHDYPAWLKAVYRHREKVINAGSPIWGWRNDSDDLALLAIEQYIKFFQHPLSQIDWFIDRMRIFQTNEIDEYAAYEIIQQIYAQAMAAGIDGNDIVRRIIWASGTKPGTCYDQPAFNGVAKLMQVEDMACIKLAFDADGNPGLKTSIPGFNRSALIRDSNDEIVCLLIFPDSEYEVQEDGKLFYRLMNGTVGVLKAFHPENPAAHLEIPDYHATIQQRMIYDSIDGDGFTKDWNNPTITSVPTNIRVQIDALPWTMHRLVKPQKMKVRLTQGLYNLRRRMIKQRVLRQDKLEEEPVLKLEE